MRGVEPHLHSETGVCKKGSKRSCNYQLERTHHEDGNCWMERITSPEEECLLKPYTQLLPPGDLPFILSAFNRMNKYYLFESGLVISFPNLTSQSLTFTYHRETQKDLCVKVTLDNLTLPLHDTIFWDCPINSQMINKKFNLTVLDDEGRGGLYSFIVPNGSRIDVNGTRLEDWQVFQYVHLTHILLEKKVPVTLQMVPLANLTYNISLLHCLDGFICNQTILTDNYILKGPERPSVYCHEDDWSHETVIFNLPEPGIFEITTQIISTQCPTQLCYLSRSPKFVIPHSMVLQKWITIITGTFFISLILFLTWYFVQRTKKGIYSALKENPRKPTLLLVYHFTAVNEFVFVKKLAIFLKEAGFINPLMVDIHGRKQNPKHWTSEQIETADRVLFLMPEDLKGKSVMPIRHQWEYALLYVSDSCFKHHNKVAVAVMPSSAAVPHQISYLKQFQLLCDLTSLINWVHGGTTFERWFLWPSLLQMASSEKVSVSLTDLRKEPKHKSEHSCMIDITELTYL